MASSRETLFHRDRWFQMQECFGILGDLLPYPSIDLQREIEERIAIFYDFDINSTVQPKTLFACIIDQYCHVNRIFVPKSHLFKAYRINRRWYLRIRSKYLDQMGLITPVDHVFGETKGMLRMEG